MPLACPSALDRDADRRASYVGGLWSPVLACVTSRNKACAAHTCVSQVISDPTWRGPFSLRRGLDSGLTFLQAEHHLFQMRFGSVTKRATHSGRPREVGVCAHYLARAPPSEGMAISARARGLEPMPAREHRRDRRRVGFEWVFLDEEIHWFS